MQNHSFKLKGLLIVSLVALQTSGIDHSSSAKKTEAGNPARPSLKHALWHQATRAVRESRLPEFNTAKQLLKGCRAIEQIAESHRAPLKADWRRRLLLEKRFLLKQRKKLERITHPSTKTMILKAIINEQLRYIEKQLKSREKPHLRQRFA
ncbi:MAG: hypothetical protein ACE5HO_01220 [bacterium]